MSKNPTIMVDQLDEAAVRRTFTTDGVTMVRLARRDKEFAQNLQFIFSARQEANGLYNIRENRKVTHRDLTRDQAITVIWNEAQKLTDSVLYGVIREVVVKAKPTVADVLAAVAEPV